MPTGNFIAPLGHFMKPKDCCDGIEKEIKIFTARFQKIDQDFFQRWGGARIAVVSVFQIVNKLRRKSC